MRTFAIVIAVPLLLTLAATPAVAMTPTPATLNIVNDSGDCVGVSVQALGIHLGVADLQDQEERAFTSSGGKIKEGDQVVFTVTYLRCGIPGTAVTLLISVDPGGCRELVINPDLSVTPQDCAMNAIMREGSILLASTGGLTLMAWFGMFLGRPARRRDETDQMLQHE